MPELPEVETVRRGLTPHLVNKRLAQVKLRRADLRGPLPSDLGITLAGRTLKGISRRAKYLLFHFDGGRVLIVHLGMSGRLLLHKTPPSSYLTHDHVILFWADGQTLVFNDARRFGLMALALEKELTAHPLFARLGPEPLDEAWTGTQLYKVLQSSKAPVKSVIMDQNRLVGVGNIYACEALFSAGIHPLRPAHKITRRQSDKLMLSIRQVLQDAIASGGSTLRDYVRSSGEAGYFQHHFNVYGRQNKPCVVCARPIEVVRLSGRSTFFCGHCQK